ncbi:MAG: hypothetical protein ABI741_12075 [Ferruginibacter sp.]
MTSIKKIFMPILAYSFAIAFFSCNGNEEKKDEAKVDETKTADTVKIEQSAPPVFTPFKLVIVKHTVTDFDKWKAGYMAHDSMRNAYGLSHYRLGRGIDDQKMVLVANKIADVQKAKEFAASASLKDAMKKAGVVGKPDVFYVDVVWTDTSKIPQADRMRIIHKVKDFDSWKKIFDAEGKEKRAQFGLIDRALERDIDDPNMVHIVFAISDMAKAKARANSPELKKLMTDAGVTGPPQIFYYKIVE